MSKGLKTRISNKTSYEVTRIGTTRNATTITGTIAKTITIATTTIMGNATKTTGKSDEKRKGRNIEMPNLSNDIVVLAKKLDIELPNVGFSHKIANRLNYLINKILTTNPTVKFPTFILSTSDDYTDDATIQPDDPTLVTLQ